MSDLDSFIHNCIVPWLQLLEVAGIGISEVSFIEFVCFKFCDIKVSYCNNVEEVGKFPSTLIDLSFTVCDNLTKMHMICRFQKLQKLAIVCCKKLELPRMESLLYFRYLNTSGCVRLNRIWGFGNYHKFNDYLLVGVVS